MKTLRNTLYALGLSLIMGCTSPTDSVPILKYGTLAINFSDAPYNYSIQIFTRDSSGNTNISGGMNAGSTQAELSLNSGTYEVAASGVEYKSSPFGKYPIYHQTEWEEAKIIAGEKTLINLSMRE